MTLEERVRELNEKAVRELVDAHRQRQDEPLVLAVRYKLDDPQDVYLLEVLDGFPGGDDDDLLPSEFAASAQLRILGKLHLVLGSPAQVRTAARSGDATIAEVRNGEVLYEDGSQDAAELKRLLQP